MYNVQTCQDVAGKQCTWARAPCAVIVMSAGIGYASLCQVDIGFPQQGRVAEACSCCRAILVQLGFYFHMQQALDSSRAMLTLPLLFTISFMLIFSIVIALFKDLPDIEGDRQVCNCT